MKGGYRVRTRTRTRTGTGTRSISRYAKKKAKGFTSSEKERRKKERIKAIERRTKVNNTPRPPLKEKSTHISRKERKGTQKCNIKR